MKLPRDSITQLTREGHCTLQVPDSVYLLPGDDGSKLDLVDYPDDWFTMIKSGDEPAIGREEGFTYLSRKGYEANKAELKAAIESAVDKRQVTWEKFEKYAEKHFAGVEKAVAKKLKNLRSKVAELEKFIP